MYHHLTGKLYKISTTGAVIETGGIGWDVLCPLSTTSRLKTGEEVTLLTHLLVRDDAHLLYGFLTEDERKLFRTLIGITGVGPASAMQILSSATPQDFALAVERQDTAFFKKIKGIGEKTAKRMILELKGAKTILPASDKNVPTGLAADAVAALVAMGLTQNEASARVEKVIAKDASLSLEDVIKHALRG